MPNKKIRAEIKKRAPDAFYSSRRKFSTKYVKIFFIVLSIFFAYFLFSLPGVYNKVSSLSSVNVYFSSFLAGILIAFGFSSAFGVGLFVLLQPQNLFLATFFGGLGAMLSDFIIFKTIKFSFKEEFQELKEKKVVKKIKEVTKENKQVVWKHYFLYALAGVIIATPFPDEIGVSILAGLTTIKQNALLIISFILHTLAILFIFSAF